jgi:hypothetical protein
MTEIVIKHEGSVPNVDAMEACIKFVYQNYTRRRTEGYKDTRTITTKRGYKVDVTEVNHPDKEKSVCSVIFEIKKLDAKEPQGWR